MYQLNIALFLIPAMLAPMALAFWFSAKGCRYLSIRFFARACQIEAGRKAFHDAVHANVDGKENV